MIIEKTLSGVLKKTPVPNGKNNRVHSKAAEVQRIRICSADDDWADVHDSSVFVWDGRGGTFQDKQGCFPFAVHSPCGRVPFGVPEDGS